MMQNNSITPMTGTEMLVPTATVGTQPSVNTPTPMGVGTPVSLFVAANSNASSADQSPVTVGCGQVVNTKSSANNKQQNKNNAATKVNKEDADAKTPNLAPMGIPAM